MTRRPHDTTSEALAAEDLLVLERRRPLTEHERRRLNMCLAASEPLQLLRQLGRDFDGNITVRMDDTSITQACVDAARKRFTHEGATGYQLVFTSLRVSLVVAITLLLSISAAAAWHRWSSLAGRGGSAPTTPVASYAPYQPAHQLAQRQESPSPATLSENNSATHVAPLIALSASPVDTLQGRSGSAAEHLGPTSKKGPVEVKSAAELFSYANAARRSGDTHKASRAYRRLQSEYPRSDEALLSHVLLARLELGRGAPGRALREFESYLARAPSGSLAQEALQGKAQSLVQLGRKTEAAATWRHLLERYPSSVYVRSAREYLGEGLH